MLKKLLKSLREYKKSTILTPICMVMEVFMEIAIPYLLAKLIDQGIEQSNLQVILKIGILLVLAAFISLFFGVQSGKFSARAGAGFAKNLRKDMYEKVQKFSFFNIDKFSTSSIVTRLTTDVTNVQEAFMMVIRGAVRAPITIIFAMIMSFTVSPKIALIFLVASPTDVTNVQEAFMMVIRGAVRAPITIIFAMIMSFTVSPKIALIFLVASPILGTLLILIAKKAHPVFERVFNTYDDLNNVVQENVKGIRVVKSFVKEEKEIEKFENVSQSIYKDFRKAEIILALNNPLMQFTIYTIITLISWFGAKLIVGGTLTTPLMQFTIYTIITLISWFGAKLIVGGTLTTGQLTSLITYAMQILNSLMMLSMVFVMITISMESAKRIVELLDEVPDLDNPKKPIREVKNGSIEFKKVSFSYVKDHKKLCLKNINLKIQSGQTIGILGGTGSSKTSLVQLIPRLYDVTKGELKVGGINVKKYDIKTLRDQVSMVLQKNELFSGTIKENLRWGNKEATDEEIINACKLAQADEFINGFPDKYDTYIEQGGTNVSGDKCMQISTSR